MKFLKQLEEGKEYSIKLNFKSRKTKYVFEKVSKCYISENNFTEVYEFKNNNGTIFVTDEHLESVEESKASKSKKKKGETCNRCLGNKVLPHLMHVNSGICFKCEGTGLI